MSVMRKTDFNPDCITYSQMNMIFNARMYYRRLTAWTRAYLISNYFGIGTAEDLFGSLYLETLDLGNMLRIVHGREAAEKYSQLLSLFAIALRDIITAQLQGDEEGVEKNVNRLYQMAAERKAFIQAINPYASPEYEDLFKIYVQYILEEANALAAGDYSRASTVYDLLTEQAERLGDAFAEGIYNYITSGARGLPLPQGDDRKCITYDQMNAISEIRMFWFELVTGIRNYMLSRYLGLGNVDEVKTRLMQMPAEFEDDLSLLFGDQVPKNYSRLYYTYLDLIGALLTAQMEGNIDEINRITRLLYQNADERAAAITALNPSFWDENEWKDRLYQNLQTTITESTTFLTGDYARNIDAFRTLLNQADSTSNYLAEGLFQYLTTEGIKS
jgi:hypothetical protein